MFFQVMAKFVVPLFLAAVLVVVFKPLHVAVREQLPHHPRLAALATTCSFCWWLCCPRLTSAGTPIWNPGRSLRISRTPPISRRSIEKILAPRPTYHRLL